MTLRMIAALAACLPMLLHAACPDYGASQAAPALPELQRKPFLSRTSSLLAARYQPWHMVHDVLVASGQSGRVIAKFDYDLVLHKDLEGERVHAWLHGGAMSEWEYLGVHTTDSDGKIELELAPRPLGDYRLHMQVEGDGSSADGWLSVVEPGREAVLFDIDGTLTLSDAEAYADYAGVRQATAYAHAPEVVQAYRDKGYRILYLTARPYWVTRDGRAWLGDHALPAWHYRTKMYGGFPTRRGTVAHKADYIRYLREEVGLNIVRAYGNAATDIKAYAAAGLPQDETWIIGEHAGKEGTRVLEGDYRQHYLDVVIPTPAASCQAAALSAAR